MALRSRVVQRGGADKEVRLDVADSLVLPAARANPELALELLGAHPVRAWAAKRLRDPFLVHGHGHCAIERDDLGKDRSRLICGPRGIGGHLGALEGSGRGIAHLLVLAAGHEVVVVAQSSQQLAGDTGAPPLEGCAPDR